MKCCTFKHEFNLLFQVLTLLIVRNLCETIWAENFSTMSAMTFSAIPRRVEAVLAAVAFLHIILVLPSDLKYFILSRYFKGNSKVYLQSCKTVTKFTTSCAKGIFKALVGQIFPGLVFQKNNCSELARCAIYVAGGRFDQTGPLARLSPFPVSSWIRSDFYSYL